MLHGWHFTILEDEAITSTNSLELSEFTQKLQEVYETSQLASEGTYQSILNIDTNERDIYYHIFTISKFVEDIYKQKEHQEMLDNLKKGDKIVTNGGLIVEITAVEGNYLVTKTADDSKIKVVKSYISSLWEE